MNTPNFSTEKSDSIGYRLALALLVLIAVAKPILIDTLDPDCFWHLRVARDLRQQGIGPIVDDISFNSIREPWTPYSWLAELGMLRVWETAGWRGAVAIHAMMSAAFVLLIAAGCRELQRTLDRRGELNTILATTAACVWSLAYLSFRPATLAIDLLALAAWLILRDRRLMERSRAIWLVVPIGVLLTNVHLTAILLPLWLGALAAGAMWERVRVRFAPTREGASSGPSEMARPVACAFAEESRDASLSQRSTTEANPARAEAFAIELKRRSERYTLLACLCAISYLATPMLPGAMKMLGQLQFQDVMVSTPIIAEMRPFYDGAFGKVSLALVIFTVASCVANRRRIRAGEWFWLLGMVIFLLRLGRFSPLFAIIAAPVAAAWWPRLSDRPLARRPVALALSVVLLIAGLRVVSNFPNVSAPLDPWLNRNVPGDYPIAAAAFVESHVSPRTGHMINEFNWGGYLAWRLGDRYQTFMDGRTQMHSPQFWRDAFLGDAASRQSLVENSDADVAILPKQGSLFGQSLHKLGWSTVWEDEQSEVMVPPTTIVTIDP